MMEPIVVFMSNYINHHQIPFCNALYEKLGEGFCFIQTKPMDRERVQMGWNGRETLSFVRYFYEEPEICKKLVMDSRVVIFGGVDEEEYIADRLKAGKPIFRYCERMYKTGQWKAISPRGLLKKYHDHTRHAKKPVYVLCAGAYVASDFHLIRAYRGKMYRWGYFPEYKPMDVDRLMEQKGWITEDGERIPYLLWAARFIDWKHPKLPVQMASLLKKKGCRFHLDIIGGGEYEEEVRSLVKELDLSDCVSLLGYKKPEEVREYMEKADIYLVTSDRQEGWGAVVNEAMNSGCAVVANHMIGAVPYLIDPEKNGRIYYDKEEEMLLGMLLELCNDPKMCQRLGREAYETIAGEWNAQTAAERLLGLIRNLGLGGAAGKPDGAYAASEAATAHDGAAAAPGGAAGPRSLPLTGPGSPAPVIGERAMKRLLHKRAAGNRRNLR